MNINLIKKGLRFCISKDARFVHSVEKNKFYPEMSDIEYLTKLWHGLKGTYINWENPQTFFEKIQWLKIHYRPDIMTTMVDKYAVKEYVAERIGWKHVIPAYGVWNDAASIDFENLPNRFVLKCTHGSGENIFVRNKGILEQEKLRVTMGEFLSDDYWLHGREWAYKDVPHCILAEELMANNKGQDINDYKIFCFGGKPECIEVDINRFTAHKRSIFDTDWNMLDVKYSYNRAEGLQPPKKLDEMLQIARTLSDGLPFVRVDLYDIDNNVYFGELTFYPDSGFGGEFIPRSFDKELGDKLILNNGPFDTATTLL